MVEDTDEYTITEASKKHTEQPQKHSLLESAVELFPGVVSVQLRELAGHLSNRGKHMANRMTFFKSSLR